MGMEGGTKKEGEGKDIVEQLKGVVEDLKGVKVNEKVPGRRIVNVDSVEKLLQGSSYVTEVFSITRDPFEICVNDVSNSSVLKAHFPNKPIVPMVVSRGLALSGIDIVGKIVKTSAPKSLCPGDRCQIEVSVDEKGSNQKIVVYKMVSEGEKEECMVALECSVSENTTEPSHESLISAPSRGEVFSDGELSARIPHGPGFRFVTHARYTKQLEDGEISQGDAYEGEYIVPNSFPFPHHERDIKGGIHAFLDPIVYEEVAAQIGAAAIGDRIPTDKMFVFLSTKSRWSGVKVGAGDVMGLQGKVKKIMKGGIRVFSYQLCNQYEKVIMEGEIMGAIIDKAS